MEFKFNFDIDKEDDGVIFSADLKISSSAGTSVNEAIPVSSDKINIRPVKEIQLGKQHMRHKDVSISSLTIGEVVLDFLEPSDVEEVIECRDDDDTDGNNAISKAICSHSDLLPQVYEGGLKVWECTLDLIDYLHEAHIDFKNKRVLDIGCGAGLLGIFALKQGADHALFQDYVSHRADIDFKNKRVLDIGCGAGLLGIFALKQGADHVLFQDYVSHRADIDFKNKRVLDIGCGAGLLGIFALKQGADHALFQDYVSHRADIDFKNKRVLDLGCGAGLLGIFALKQGADHVLFQDSNEEVLHEMTISNVLLNILDADEDEDEDNGKKSDVVASRCTFLSGDWSQMETFLTNSSQDFMKYDTILTSETIYSITSQPVLHDLMKAILKPTGTVYVAAKTHYFGVGGGTRMFEDLVKERGDFTIGVCKEYKQGVQREILKMELIQDDASSR